MNQTENKPKESSFSAKQNMSCPKCGRQITWFNDIPLRGFCWGTPEKEHPEYSKIVKKQGK